MNYGIYIMIYNQARGVSLVGPITGDPVKYMSGHQHSGFQVIEIMSQADWTALQWDAAKDADMSSKAEYVGEVKEVVKEPTK